jgi:hypothetical protein
MDVNLRWPGTSACSGSGGNAIYNNRSGTANFDIIVNAGRTLSITETDASFGIDGANAGSYPGTERGGGYTVWGTLICAGHYQMGSNNASSKPYLTIRNGGLVRTQYLDYKTDNVPAGGSLTIENGGALEITGADALNNCWINSSSGSIAYSIGSNSAIEYRRSGIQNVPGNLFQYGNIIYANSGEKRLISATTTVNGAFTLNNSSVFATETVLSSYDLFVAGNFTLNNTTSFATSAYDRLNLNTINNSAQTYSGNNNPIRCLNFSSTKSSGGFTQIGTTAPLIIKNNFNLTYSGTAIYSANANSITLGGNWNNTGSNYFAEGNSLITFNGTGGQQLWCSGGESFYNLTIHNTASGITLNNQLVLTNVLTLIDGLIHTSNTNILELTATASCPSGGSIASFVNGPMRKTGSTDFIFPVGTNSPGVDHYRTIAISNLSSSETFTAQFYRAQAILLGPIVAPAAPMLHRVSWCEYWSLARAGAATANITLSWNLQSPCNAAPYVTSTSGLVIARNTGMPLVNGSGNWNTYGVNSFTGNNSTGTVTWNNVNSFNLSSPTPFAIGTTDLFESPLPSKILTFDVKKYQQQSHAAWSVSYNEDNRYYILERSSDGLIFSPIDTQLTSRINGTAFYKVVDSNPYPDKNFYRLRIIQKDGSVHYSPTRIVEFPSKNKIQIFPNPATNRLLVKCFNPERIKTIDIMKLNGQLMMRLHQHQTIKDVNVETLPPGTYIIKLYGIDGIQIEKFIKQ